MEGQGYKHIRFFSRGLLKTAERKAAIYGNMSIREVVRRYPGTARVFEEYGLECAACEAALFETVDAGARVHGVSTEDLVDALNRAVTQGGGRNLAARRKA